MSRIFAGWDRIGDWLGQAGDRNGPAPACALPGARTLDVPGAARLLACAEVVGHESRTRSRTPASRETRVRRARDRPLDNQEGIASISPPTWRNRTESFECAHVECVRVGACSSVGSASELSYARAGICMHSRLIRRHNGKQLTPGRDRHRVRLSSRVHRDVARVLLPHQKGTQRMRRMTHVAAAQVKP